MYSADIIDGVMGGKCDVVKPDDVMVTEGVMTLRADCCFDGVIIIGVMVEVFIGISPMTLRADCCFDGVIIIIIGCDEATLDSDFCFDNRAFVVDL